MGSFFTPLSWNDSGFILTGVMNTITISLVAIIAGHPARFSCWLHPL